MITFLDFETYSEVNIKKAGGYRYAQHPSTIVLICSYAEDDGPVRRWFPGDPFPFRRGKFVAHNSEFEYLIWKYVCSRLYGWRTVPKRSNWIDTASVARYYGLPGSLDGSSKALHLKYKKDDVGHRIMMKLSRPRKPSAANPDARWTPETKPDDFEKLYNYCDQDVVVERAIYHKLGELPKIERRIWEHNCIVNDRGVPCDAELATKVLEIREIFVVEANARVAELTDGEVTAATQVQRLTAFLGVDTLAKDTLETRDRSACTDVQNELMDIRLSVGQSSISKFIALLEAVCDDGRLHGMFMYHAANQTARFGGMLIQPHNLPRPTISQDEIDFAVWLIHSGKSNKKILKELKHHFDDVMGVFKSLVRAALCAENGKRFVVSDFSSVEARKLAWVSGCHKLIDIFATGGSPYLDMADSLFNKKVDKEEDFFEYFIGKQTILGAGYGMSGTRFAAECESRGVQIDDGFADEAIKTYRTRYPEIPSLWWAVNRAAITAVKDKTATSVGRCTFIFKRVPFERLVCILPSGREMSYPYPSIRWIYPPWESEDKIEQLHYWTVAQKTYKWSVTNTYGGSMVENICQGSCRDVLCSKMLVAEKHGLDIIMHVHDEMMTEEDYDKADRKSEVLDNIMSVPPPWALGLPLSGEGYVAKRFKKG